MEALQFFDKHYKLFIGAIIGVIILCVGAIIIVPIVRAINRPTILELAIAPTTAKIELNGVEYQNGTHRVEPGEYNIKITKDGFVSKEATITVPKYEQTHFSAYILNKEESYAYFERSAADIEVLRQINTDNDDGLKAFLDEYDKKIKIKEILPINATYNLNEGIKGAANYLVEVFITDGSTHPECHHAFCLRVIGDRKKDNRKAHVKEMLKINGYNYEDYEVIYD
jgi:hypothetical protein